MAEVDVGGGGVDAVLDAEGPAGLDAARELLPQFRFRRDLLDAAADQGHLFVNAFHDLAPARVDCGASFQLARRCKLETCTTISSPSVRVTNTSGTARPPRKPDGNARC